MPARPCSPARPAAAVAVALAGNPGLAFVAGLAAYVVTLGSALRLGRQNLSMTHFVIEAEAEE